MENFFSFKEIEEKCSCLLSDKDKKVFQCSDNKNSDYYWKDYIYTHQGVSGDPYDILFLSDPIVI